MQQAMMADFTPAARLKGPALSFFLGTDNLDIDPVDEITEHNI